MALRPEGVVVAAPVDRIAEGGRGLRVDFTGEDG